MYEFFLVLQLFVFTTDGGYGLPNTIASLCACSHKPVWQLNVVFSSVLKL